MTTILRNARIIDGTGAPWFRGSIEIGEGKIRQVTRKRDIGGRADTVVNLEESILCPGFVDAHSHADLAMFRDTAMKPKLRQGITTVVVGQDGFSMAPMASPEMRSDWARYLSGLAGSMEASWLGATIEDYLRAVGHAAPACNVATLIGHGTVRRHVMGWEPREPNDDELDTMRELVVQGINEGAVGFSTGLEYSPHRHATTGEVEHLAAALRDTGLPFVAHIRSYGNEMWEALDEFVDIGATAGVPVHLSHFKLGGNKQGKAERALHLAEAARERGVNFTADLYPYSPGSSMLLALIPTWVHAEGPKGMLRSLRDQADRERIKHDIETREGSWTVAWDDVRVSHVTTEANEHLLGNTIQEIANDQGDHPVDAVCDLLVEEELGVTVVLGSVEQQLGPDLVNVLQHELVCVGTDGIFGKRPHPRIYGTYPRILSELVRDRAVISLEEAVRKMTSLPANIHALQDKGMIRPGADADLVVFRPNHVTSPATVLCPNQFPSGIKHVVVNGEFVVQHGEFTDRRPGRAIFGPASTKLDSDVPPKQ